MDPFISDFNNTVLNIILHLKEDLKTIRTGRANPSMIENIIVDAYGGQSKLRMMELATITTEGPSVIIIIPFDPSTVQDIEKAILKSPLGFSPQVSGARILVKVPALSEEQRLKFSKLIGQIVEEKKSNLRNARDDVRKKIKAEFENKTITEDGKYRLEKEIDNTTQKFTAEIQQIKEGKEKEVMEV